MPLKTVLSTPQYTKSKSIVTPDYRCVCWENNVRNQTYYNIYFR